MHRGDRHRDLGRLAGWHLATGRGAATAAEGGSALSSSRRLRNASKGLGAPKVAALVLREHDHTLAFWRALGYESDERVDRRVRSFR